MGVIRYPLTGVAPVSLNKFNDLSLLGSIDTLD